MRWTRRRPAALVVALVTLGLIIVVTLFRNGTAW